MVLTFTGLGALMVVAPPPYVFLVEGLLSPFSNCPLLIASSIFIPQSHMLGHMCFTCYEHMS